MFDHPIGFPWLISSSVTALDEAVANSPGAVTYNAAVGGILTGWLKGENLNSLWPA